MELEVQFAQFQKGPQWRVLRKPLLFARMIGVKQKLLRRTENGKSLRGSLEVLQQGMFGYSGVMGPTDAVVNIQMKRMLWVTVRSRTRVRWIQLVGL